MRKLSLVIFFSLFSIFKAKAFEHIYELKAVYDQVQRLANQISAKPMQDACLKFKILSDLVFNSRPEQEVSSEISALYKQIEKYLNSNALQLQRVYASRHMSSASDTTITRCIKEIKEEMCVFIINLDSVNAERIIAQSKILYDPQVPDRALPVEDVTAFDATRSSSPSVSFDMTPHSFPAGRFVPQNPDALLYDSGSSASSASSVQPENEYAFETRMEKSLIAACIATLVYGASRLEVCKQNPALARTAQVVSSLSGLYAVYNALKK